MENNEEGDHDDYDPLALTLATPSLKTKAPPPEPQPPQENHEQPFSGVELSADTLGHPPTAPQPNHYLASMLPFYPSTWSMPSSAPAPTPASARSSTASRSRCNGRSKPRLEQGQEKSETVPAPFPWATDMRAKVHTLDYLRTQQINTITGNVKCKNCGETYELSYDLEERFEKISRLVLNIKHRRAPDFWLKPTLPACAFCVAKNSLMPVIARKKKEINWLFLQLGGMLGCLTLNQLRYFCKHSRNHRSGAKSIVLYYTYLNLCDQLCPDGRFALNVN